MRSGGDLDRRSFLVTASAVAGGLTLGFAIPLAEAARAVGAIPEITCWIAIAPDDSVTIRVARSEMGQGAMTGLAEMIAEELDVAYDSVDMVCGDTDRCPWDMGTFGSLSTRVYGQAVRRAGAEARAVLLQMASEQLKTPVDRLKVDNGIITDPGSGKKVTYGQLVQGKRIERHVSEAPVKTPAQMTQVGRSVVRKDAHEKVTGKGQYAGDIILPGMLCARLVRPPAHGAKLKSIDTNGAEKAGAKVVRDGSLIAVLHEHRDIADKALDLVKAESLQQLRLED